MPSQGHFTWSFAAPVMWRVSRWCIGLSVLAVLATFAYIIFRDSLGLPRRGWFRWIPAILGLLPLCVILPAGHWLLRGIRRDFHASGGRLCTHCGYDVSTLAPTGTCPECGQHYDIEADAAVWRASGLVYANAVRSTESGAP